MPRRSIAVGCVAFLVGVAAVPTVLAAPSAQGSATTSLWPLLAAGLAWLTPAGFVLIAAASAPPDRAWQTALAGPAGVALAALAGFAVGFALAFGGIGLAYAQTPAYSALIWEWSPLSLEWGPNWGVAGLTGWALAGPAATAQAYALFFATLPWAATAALVPLLALRGRTPAPVALLASLLVAGLLYPLAINWTWGGGWLANLGLTLGLGHGFVDFASAGAVHLVGGAVALAGLLTWLPRRPRRAQASGEPTPLPPVHLPLLASVGAFFILAGSLAWAWANPLLDLDSLMLQRGAVNAVLAAAGGALLPLAYTWFATGRPDPAMAAKGLAAGAIVAAAVGPFTPPWAALALGTCAGLLVPLLTYLVMEVLHVADDSGVVPTHVAGAVIGLLGIGLLADGLTGAGWNRVGPQAYLGAAGQGVTGLLAASGLQPDWPGQMQAQAIGLAALLLMPLLAGALLLGPLAAIVAGLRRAAGAQPVAPLAEAPASMLVDSASSEPPSV